MTRSEIIADLKRRLTGNGDFNPDTVFPLFKEILRELEADAKEPASPPRAALGNAEAGR